MPPVTHNPNIDVDITLEPAPATAAGFGILMIIVPLASNTLDGDRVMAFASTDEAQTAQTAGFISAATLAAVTAAFAQNPAPDQVKVGYIDLVGAETYSTALTAIIVYDPDFYVVAILSRADADILAISSAVESQTKKLLASVQSDDAGFLTGTYPAALSALLTRERTIINWHSDDNDYQDTAYAANRLAVGDPDTLSVAWNPAPVSGVDPLTTMTTAQRNFAIANNVNIGLEFGGSAFVIDPGVTATGRAISEIVSADWFEIRLEERLTALALAYGARGEKLPMNRTGQIVVLAEVEALFRQGIDAQHFNEGQTEIEAETITAADIAARRMRFTGRAQLTTGARLLDITLNFSRTALFEEAA